MDHVREESFLCKNSVLLYDDGRKHGATDITDKNAGFEQVQQKLG